MSATTSTSGATTAQQQQQGGNGSALAAWRSSSRMSMADELFRITANLGPSPGDLRKNCVLFYSKEVGKEAAACTADRPTCTALMLSLCLVLSAIAKCSGT